MPGLKNTGMQVLLIFIIFVLISTRIDAQNVGIGTVSPSATLDVIRGAATGGTAQFRGTQYVSHFNYSTNEDTYIRAGKDNGNVILNDLPNGKVGIGTASPGFPLSFPNTTGDKISLWGSSGAHYGFGIQGSLLQIHSANSVDDIAFGYGSSDAFTETMRIKGDGKVGIGTSAPFAHLTFVSNATGEIISLHGSASNNYGFGIQLGLLQIHTDMAGADIAFGYGTSSSFTETMRIKGNGNVGIGTTLPTQKLRVEGTTRLNGSVGINTSPTTAALRVFGTTILDGNVGINTAPGTAALTVEGNIQINGFTQTTGNVGIGMAPTGFSLELSGQAAKPGGGTWFASSDVRLKENVMPYRDGLSMLLKINPVKYHYNKLSGYDTKPEYVGVLAQELLSIAPYMVSSFQKNGESYYNADNSAMTYMLINAVKEQQVMISKLVQQIDELKKLFGKQ